MITQEVIGITFDDGIRDTIARYPAFSEYPGVKAAIAFPGVLMDLFTTPPESCDVPGCNEFEGPLLLGAMHIASRMECRLVEDNLCDDVIQLLITLSHPNGSCDWRFFFHLKQSQPILPPHR